MNTPSSNSIGSSTKQLKRDEDKAQSSSQPLDTFFEMMADSSRRRVLVALDDFNPQVHDHSIPVHEISRDDERDHSPLQLMHSHLPKLADAELIEWHRDTDRVQKGPCFDKIRPLVEMIQEHANEFSTAQR